MYMQDNKAAYATLTVALGRLNIIAHQELTKINSSNGSLKSSSKIDKIR